MLLDLYKLWEDTGCDSFSGSDLESNPQYDRHMPVMLTD